MCWMMCGARRPYSMLRDMWCVVDDGVCYEYVILCICMLWVVYRVMCSMLYICCYVGYVMLYVYYVCCVMCSLYWVVRGLCYLWYGVWCG